MITDDFLANFKGITEELWRQTPINPTIYGFQFQPGTCWNPGLGDNEIREYENVLGARFPQDFKAFLKIMNGTDLTTLNIYANCGEPSRESVGVYSYPKDLGVVRQRVKAVSAYRQQLTATLAEQGFVLGPEESLVPIYIHRYVVCTSDLGSSVVLSIADGDDAIVYGRSLREYLEREFLRDPADHHK